MKNKQNYFQFDSSFDSSIGKSISLIVSLGLISGITCNAAGMTKVTGISCEKLLNPQRNTAFAVLNSNETTPGKIPQTALQTALENRAVTIFTVNHIDPGSATFNVTGQIKGRYLVPFIVPRKAVEATKVSDSAQRTQAPYFVLQVDPTQVVEIPLATDRLIERPTETCALPSCRQSMPMVTSTTPTRNHLPSTELKPDELLEAAVALFQHNFASDQPIESVPRSYVRTLLDTGYYTAAKIQEAIDRGTIANPKLGIQSYSTRGFATLSNQGTNQYFWIRLKNQGSPVPARILDLHEIGFKSSTFRTTETYPPGYIILAEVYLNHDRENGAYDKKEIRLLTHLDVQGLLTDKELLREYTRDSAKEIFDSELTLEQIRVTELAQRLQMNIYGYHNPFNTPGAIQMTPYQNAHYDMTSDIVDLFREKLKHVLPMAKQNRLNAIEKEFQRQSLFPDIRTFSELDFFSGLHPKNLFEQWFTEDLIAGQNIEFVWVITSDGSLRIAPQADIGMSFIPQTLRTAQGRRIFAAGKFFVNADGTLTLLLDSTKYEAQLVRNTSGLEIGSFESSRHIEDFVYAIFLEIAGKKISVMQNRPLRVANGSTGSWMQPDWIYHGGTSDHSRSFNYIDASWTKTEPKNFEPKGNRKSRNNDEKKEATDASTSARWTAYNPPMELSEFAKKMSRPTNDEEVKLNYGLYIFAATRTTPLKAIAKIKQSMIKKLGSAAVMEDPSHPNNNIIKNINMGFSFLKDYYKNRDIAR